ncbi:MAG: tetraacyldisaccharide 4'-kinase [Sedimentisphaerales bacterium]
MSIGNITAGGTGKTPMVIWLCNFLQNRGSKCAILTRGYKSTGGQDDEPTNSEPLSDCQVVRERSMLQDFKCFMMRCANISA